MWRSPQKAQPSHAQKQDTSSCAPVPSLPPPSPQATKAQIQAAHEALGKCFSSSTIRTFREEDLGVRFFMDIDLGMEEDKEREGCLEKTTRPQLCTQILFGFSQQDQMSITDSFSSYNTES